MLKVLDDLTTWPIPGVGAVVLNQNPHGGHKLGNYIAILHVHIT